MRKIKTARGTEKRFKKTASGGCKRKHASLCHILTKKKSTKHTRHFRPQPIVSKKDLGLFLRCVPDA